MTILQRFALIFLFVSFPFLMHGGDTKSMAGIYEVYSSICLFFALVGMILLMYASNYRLLCGIFGTINALFGLPVFFIMLKGNFNQSITGPILSLLIGAMLLIRLIGIGSKQKPKSSS